MASSLDQLQHAESKPADIDSDDHGAWTRVSDRDMTWEEIREVGARVATPVWIIRFLSIHSVRHAHTDKILHMESMPDMISFPRSLPRVPWKPSCGCGGPQRCGMSTASSTERYAQERGR